MLAYIVELITFDCGMEFLFDVPAGHLLMCVILVNVYF